MKYYKVNEQGDGVYIFNCFVNGKNTSISLIKNELLTEKEREKYNVPLKYLEEKNISKNKIFWSFGCRFEIRG